jgi:hypothetical protein
MRVQIRTLAIATFSIVILAIGIFQVESNAASKSGASGFGGSNITDTLIAEGETTQAGSYLIDQDANYTSRPLLTVGDVIPLLEGEFPFLQTDESAAFPPDNLGDVDGGDNPLTASATETFTFPGSFDGAAHAGIDNTNYVFINHSLDTDEATDAVGGRIHGSRISLVAFDANWNIIGGRNLVETVRVPNPEASNTLRNTTDPDTGTPYTGFVFAEYVLNPASGDYEANLEAGEDTFIVGDPAFLALPSDVEGLTWQERLEESFPPVYNALGNDNFTRLGSLSIANGFRRRNGQANPYVFNGDGIANGLGYFHIANGTTVPVVGMGAFANEQIISVSQYREEADAAGLPIGQTVLLSPEASADDGELYMSVGDQFQGNGGGFATFMDVLNVLRVKDAAETVLSDEAAIIEGTSYTAEWVLVDGDPLDDLESVPAGKAVNTLNAEALSEWVNGNDGGVLRSTNFSRLGGIAEASDSPGTFYFTSGVGLYRLTFAADSPTGAGTLELVFSDGNIYDSVASDGDVVLQDNEGKAFRYTIATDTLTPFVEANQAGIDPNGVTPWETEGTTVVDPDFDGTGLSAYLTTVAANSIVTTSGGGFGEDGTSDELFFDGNLGTGGQLLLSIPTGLDCNGDGVVNGADLVGAGC